MGRNALLGQAGENATLGRYLERGYALVARNWRCDIGELDLVVRGDGALVVCEVKTRHSGDFGAGWEAVTRTKQQRLRRLAARFLAAEPADRGWPVRFDVASVMKVGGRLEVEIFEDAF